MAQRLAAINDLLKKGKRIVITETMKQNIKECVNMLTQEPVLAFPDFNKKFILRTDASQQAVGAVLAQEWSNGERPVAFGSRRLTDTEERYSALERELLAIVWAVDHFRPYLYGRTFVVQSDHKPLQWVSKLKESSARVQRWKEALQQYQFEVNYTPGRDNVVADWLSRAHQVNVTTNGDGGSGPSLRRFFQTWDPEGDPMAEEDSEQQSDATLSAEERRGSMEEVEEIIVAKKRYIIWVATNQGLPNIKYGKKSKTCMRCTVRAPLGTSDDTVQRLLKDASAPNTTTYLYVGNASVWAKISRLWEEEKIGTDRRFIRCRHLGEVVTDPQLQKDIIEAYHLGKTNHRGINETLANLKKKYYWKDMKKMVQEEIGKCEVCLQTKYSRHPVEWVQQETPTDGAPLKTIQADVFTWGGVTWVTLVDTFSKIAMAVAVRAKSGEEILRALRKWGQVYGTPDKIITDGGREFRNQGLRDLLKSWNTQHHISTAGHPQGHGTVERLHNTLSEHMRLLETGGRATGKPAMQVAITAYNHSVHSATGYTPFEVLFGTIRPGRDVPETNGEPGVVAAIRQVQENQVGIQKKTQERLQKEKQKRVGRHNTQIKDLPKDLKIGDEVFRRVVSNRTKQTKRYEGPFRVVGIHEHNVFTIRALGSDTRQYRVHREQLRVGRRAEDTEEGQVEGV